MWQLVGGSPSSSLRPFLLIYTFRGQERLGKVPSFRIYKTSVDFPPPPENGQTFGSSEEFRGGRGQFHDCPTEFYSIFSPFLLITAAHRPSGLQVSRKIGLLPVCKCGSQASYILGQRFSACFLLKFTYQRGEGEKGRECKFQNKALRTFDPRNALSPKYGGREEPLDVGECELQTQTMSHIFMLDLYSNGNNQKCWGHLETPAAPGGGRTQSRKAS